MQPASSPQLGSPAATRPRAPRWPPPAGVVQAGTRALLAQAFAPSAPARATLEQLQLHLERHTLGRGPVTRVPAGFAPSWWLVLEGRIVVGRPGSNGEVLESRTVERGQWFDVASAWLGSAWIEAALCPAPVTLGALPLQLLLDCAQGDRELLLGMGRTMAERVRQLSEGRHELATKDVLSRLALWLLRQPRGPGARAGSAGTGAETIHLPVQKRSIARQLVMAQATLSRCFRRLVELGCIDIEGYTVTIRDLAALQRLAGQGSGPAPG